MEGPAEREQEAPAAHTTGGSYLNPLLDVFLKLRLSYDYGIPAAVDWGFLRLLAAQVIATRTGLPGAQDGSDSLARRANEVVGVESDDPRTLARAIPCCWLRSEVSCSLMDESGYRLILRFSRGHVWDIGCGSGYNAFVLHRLGARVHATDTPRNGFVTRFYPVQTAPDDEVVAELARAGGAALYFWPLGGYHELRRWLRLGGRRVITVGCWEPDHFWIRNHPDEPEGRAPLICPRFPPKHLRGKFRLVATHTPPHHSAKDKTIQDEMQLYELVD